MLRDGDIIAFSGKSLLSDTINLVTFGLLRWGITHVGIMGHTTDGQFLLFESTTLDPMPDKLLQKQFNGTQVHDLAKVVDSYKGKVWHYPLVTELTDSQVKHLSEFLMETLHIPYDTHGAIRSVILGIPGSIDYTNEDLTKIFCSEWLMAAYKHIGVFETHNSSKWNPNAAIKELVKNKIIAKPSRLK